MASQKKIVRITYGIWAFGAFIWYGLFVHAFLVAHEYSWAIVAEHLRTDLATHMAGLALVLLVPLGLLSMIGLAHLYLRRASMGRGVASQQSSL